VHLKLHVLLICLLPFFPARVCIGTIRFSAGPPYEDIAFKIVKKEWEFSHKRGYKCVFDKGVLHLYFNFRRYGYRR
jgi:hypothetical protein